METVSVVGTVLQEKRRTVSRKIKDGKCPFDRLRDRVDMWFLSLSKDIRLDNDVLLVTKDIFNGFIYIKSEKMKKS